MELMLGQERPDFAKEEVSSWEGYLRILDSLYKVDNEDYWMFKGILTEWHLAPTLERICKHWEDAVTAANNRPAAINKVALEKKILRDFKRRYHEESDLTPQEDDNLGWLALMQHHGAPTRLLDYTYSPYVAAYFALTYLLEKDPREPEKNDSKEKTDCKAAVWAFRNKWFVDVVRMLLPCGLQEDINILMEHYDPILFNRAFINNEHQVQFIFPVNPYRLPRRLSVQQGGFLCPGDITFSFEENMKHFTGWDSRDNVLRIDLPRSLVHEVICQLLRMNISNESLFPGVDGFARSYSTRIALWLH